MVERRADTDLETLLEFLLLLVYYTKSEINFVCLFKVWLHSHDLGESLLCVLKRAISIIEYPNAVPQFWLLKMT